MMQRPSTWQISLLHPLNLGVLALAVAAGLCAAWWLLPIGLGVWLLMVVLYQSNRDLRLSLVLHSRQGLAKRLQDRFDRIERVQISLYNSLASSPRRTRKFLQPLQDALNNAVDVVHRYCLRLTTLENYRMVQKTRNSQAEIEVLNDSIAKALDPRVRAEYEETRQVLLRRQENLERIHAFMERVDAQLNNLTAVFEEILTQVVSLQAVDPGQIAVEVKRLNQVIQDEIVQLSQSEREISELQIQNR